MRKILTFGLFLLFIGSVAAQNRRGDFSVRPGGTESPVIKALDIPRPIYHDSDTVSIVFMGDMMMHRDQIHNARTDGGIYDFSQCFPKVSHLIKRADIAVANMEFTLAGEPYTGYPCFSAPDSYAEAVAESGVSIFLTANNHILDKGRRGAERTLGIYSKMEEKGCIQHTGTSVSDVDDSLRFPLRIVSKGIRIALINFTYGTNCRISEDFPKVHKADTGEIAAAIKRSKETGADFIIALPHWGNEYVLKHSRSQEDLAHWLAEQGCDAVIGAHPHVLQDVEELTIANENGIGTRTVPVIYSLGNFISNMSAPNTQVGMILTIPMTVDRFGDKNMLAPKLTLTWCSRPGHLTGSHTTIPIKEYIGKRAMWLNPWDYDKMMDTYERVKKETGIKD